MMMTRKEPLTFSIEPVTDPADVPTLATIFDVSLRSDTFHQLMSMYSPESVYDTIVNLTRNALDDQSQYVFKAVVEDHESDGTIRRTIVGVSHWSVGYINIPKVDPFEAVPSRIDAAVVESSIVPTLPSTDSAREAYEDARRQGFNAYIRNIRGKKHVYLRRVAVLPAHQGRGIASRLVQWGAELADREGLVGWLNARPAGIGIYKKYGWTPVASASFDIPGIKTEPVVSMLRKPDPAKKAKS